MSKFRWLLIAFVILLVAATAWIALNRPRRVDMAAYVPAETIIYLEANDLFDVAEGITSTDAWKELAPAAGLASDFGRFGWMRDFARWTGLGPARWVALARAQVAVAVLGFDASEEETTTLKITPRVVLVAETHLGETRLRPLVESMVGDFARREFEEPRLESKETDGIFFYTWSSPASGRKKIIAAVSGSGVVVGNDESAVASCFSAKRGASPSLAGDKKLQEARERMDAGRALAFGYVPEGGAAKLLEVLTLAYVGQLTQNPRTQSIVASVLPQLASKSLRGAAWASRVEGGAVEDRYFLSLAEGLAARVSDSLDAADDHDQTIGEFLPNDTYQLTSYRYRNPAAAWRNFNAALASQLDALSAPFVNLFLSEALKPYGIEEPGEFLGAVGADVVTARLDGSGASTVLVVSVRERDILEKLVRKRLGLNLRVVRVGDVEMLVSRSREDEAEEADEKAASFVGAHLVVGSENSVRRCLEARASGKTLSASEGFKNAPRDSLNSPSAGAITFTDDREPARKFVSRLSGRRALRDDETGNPAAPGGALPKLNYAVTESRFVADGYERVTRSSFGNFGVLVTRFAPE